MHSFWKSRAEQLHKDWGRSPMPSYAEALTTAELDDLVAFLAARCEATPLTALHVALLGSPPAAAAPGRPPRPRGTGVTPERDRNAAAEPRQLAHLLAATTSGHRHSPLAQIHAGQRRRPAARLGLPVARGRQDRDLAHRHRRHPLHHREAAHRDRARRPHRPAAVELPPARAQRRARLLRRRQPRAGGAGRRPLLRHLRRPPGRPRPAHAASVRWDVTVADSTHRATR